MFHIIPSMYQILPRVNPRSGAWASEVTGIYGFRQYEISRNRLTLLCWLPREQPGLGRDAGHHSVRRRGCPVGRAACVLRAPGTSPGRYAWGPSPVVFFLAWRWPRSELCCRSEGLKASPPSPRSAVRGCRWAPAQKRCSVWCLFSPPTFSHLGIESQQA